MSFSQYLAIANAIEKRRPVNLLVFGLGFDSLVWNDLNRDGKTVFLEDDEEWIYKFRNSNLEIFHIVYNTKVENHEKYGFDHKNLEVDLNRELKEVAWDVIVVDAPLGHQPPRPWKGPGRMSSLFMAKKLSSSATLIIVDDFGRDIEKRYATEYFGEENISQLVGDKLAFFTLEKENGK